MPTTYIDERKGVYTIKATEEEIKNAEREAAAAAQQNKQSSKNYQPKTENGKHWTQELHDLILGT